MDVAYTGGELRVLKPTWSPELVILSYCISWLGAYTSFQLHIHAQYTRNGWVWSALGSVAFGFCAIWSMHFLGMLACRLDVSITLNVPLTVLSAMVAVFFTFVAFMTGGDVPSFWKRMPRFIRRFRPRARHHHRIDSHREHRREVPDAERNSDPERQPLVLPEDTAPRHEHENDIVDHIDVSGPALLGRHQHFLEPEILRIVGQGSPPLAIPGALARPARPRTLSQTSATSHVTRSPAGSSTAASPVSRSAIAKTSASSSFGTIGSTGTTGTTAAGRPSTSSDTDEHSSTSEDLLREGERRDSQESSEATSSGSSMNAVARRLRLRTVTVGGGENGDGGPDELVVEVQKLTWREWVREQLAVGLSRRTIARAGIWAAAIVFMHYCGMWALIIPSGFIKWDLLIVLLSYGVAFSVCLVACVAMHRMEVHFGRQIAVSSLASLGVCAMHYTGMQAATFYTTLPQNTPGQPQIMTYPAYLPFTIVVIAIFVCLASNAMLADSAIVSRVRMAEMILTKRRLWRIMAEKEAAEREREVKAQFISVASHEIRTPLHTVNGYADLLVRSDLTAEQMLYVTSIQQACQSLSVIAGNVLDFDKLERNNVESDATPIEVDVRAMLDSVCKLSTSGDPESPAVETIVSVAPRVPQYVFIDGTYALRVFMNLYSNAQKFTHNGYICIDLDLDQADTTSTYPALVFRVRDTGIGIPPAFRTAVFEPFRQVDSSLTRVHQGSGLGLSIVKHLVQRMRGTIDVESAVGEGSTFTVRLPIERGPLGMDRLPLVDIRASGEERREEGDTEKKKRRVRVLCADEKTQRLFVDLWRIHGLEAFPADSSDPEQEADIIWTDVTTVQSNPVLRTLLDADADADQKGEPSQAEADGTHYQTSAQPILCILYSSAYDLLPLEPAVSNAPHVRLFKRPLIMQNALALVDNPRPVSDERRVVHRVRFAEQASMESDDEPRGRATPPTPVRVSSFTFRGEASASPAPSASKGRVLLVEDNLINQRLGKRLVEKLGYNVATANNGRDAINLVEKEQFDVCLMDCQMPLMDGFTATRRIRELETQGRLQGRLHVIALTANVTSDSEAKCRACGMDDFLPKPLRIEDLERVLSLAVNKPEPSSSAPGSPNLL